MDNKPKITGQLPGTLVSIITILISVNFYFSLYWWYKLLEPHQLNYLSLLSKEDYLYTMWRLNDFILIFPFISIIFSLILLLFEDNVIREFQYIKNKVNERNEKAFIILSMVLTIVMFALYFILSYMGCIYAAYLIPAILFLFIFPLVYIVYEKKRVAIIVLFTIVTILFGRKNITDILQNIESESNYQSFIFDYEGEQYGNSKWDRLIFRGYANTVLLNDSTKQYSIFETDKITYTIYKPLKILNK